MASVADRIDGLINEARQAERTRQAEARDAESNRQDALDNAEAARANGMREAAASWRSTARTIAEEERSDKYLHLEAQNDRVEQMNAILADACAQLDGILEATLPIDDFLDLEMLRETVTHPEFTSPRLEPTPQPAPIEPSPEPVFVEPKKRFLTGKKKHAQTVEAERQSFAAVHAAWQGEVAAIPRLQLEAMQAYAQAEQERVAALAADRAQYERECAEREAKVAAANAELDGLIAGLAQGSSGAVATYAALILSKSQFPADFIPQGRFSFDAEGGELRVNLTVPAPDSLPPAKAYKYVKSSGEIQAVAMTLKDRRELYAGALHKTALRVIHELFEADRGAVIKSISMAVGANYIHPGTGQAAFAPLLAVAVSRSVFLEIDLSLVTPAETLKHLGAVMSKKPLELEAISTDLGVQVG